MKCPACGYLSFDDLEECRKCGASLLSLEKGRLDEKGGLRQEELFLPEQDKEEATAGGALSSPVLDDGEGDEESEGEASPPSALIFDDESGVPEDLWIEEGAGFIARLKAVAVDLAVLGGVLILFLGAAVLVLSTSGYGWTRLKTPEGIAALFLPFYLLGLFLGLSYFTFFFGWSGRTPGKALLRLDVRRTDGGEMTYTRGFLRGVGYLVSLTFAGFGFLWILFDERKRGWHDYLSGTWVKDLKSEG
jgi:uncharacterized RDD family membrane protein YckC